MAHSGVTPRQTSSSRALIVAMMQWKSNLLEKRLGYVESVDIVRLCHNGHGGLHFSFRHVGGVVVGSFGSPASMCAKLADGPGESYGVKWKLSRYEAEWRMRLLVYICLSSG